MVTNEVTILLANLSVTSDRKAAQIDQTGQTNQIMMTSPKQTKKEESLTQSETMTMGGIEIEREPEECEFDDLSDVDYDLDYTVQY